MNCTATKKDGARCQAQALTDSDLCHFHDPKQETVRREGWARGGLTTGAKIRRLIPTHLDPDSPDVMLKTPEDAKALIERVTNWTLKGAIGTPVSTAAVNALTAFVRLIEVSEHEKRIEAIERKLKVADEH